MPGETSQRAGPLRNGNPRCDLATVRRCGARTRAGHPCRQPAMRNGRCRLHGGLSTGARTEAGKAAQIAAHTRTGEYGAAGRALQRVIRGVRRLARLIAQDIRLPQRFGSIGAWLARPDAALMQPRRRPRTAPGAPAKPPGKATGNPPDKASATAAGKAAVRTPAPPLPHLGAAPSSMPPRADASPTAAPRPPDCTQRRASCPACSSGSPLAPTTARRLLDCAQLQFITPAAAARRVRRPAHSAMPQAQPAAPAHPPGRSGSVGQARGPPRPRPATPAVHQNGRRHPAPTDRLHQTA